MHSHIDRCKVLSIMQIMKDLRTNKLSFMQMVTYLCMNLFGDSLLLKESATDLMACHSPVDDPHRSS